MASPSPPMASNGGGTVVRDLRRAAGITQRELARLLSCPPSTIARWESGVTSPSFDRVASAALACGFRLVPRFVPYDPEVRVVIRRLLRATPRNRLLAAARAGRLVLRGRASFESARHG